jgi:hypothetical protein
MRQTALLGLNKKEIPNSTLKFAVDSCPLLQEGVLKMLKFAMSYLASFESLLQRSLILF